MIRLRIVAAAAVIAAAGALALAPAAAARPAPTPASPAALAPYATSPDHASRLGVTRVKTAPGIAGTFLSLGVLPLPEVPQTGFTLTWDNTLQAIYSFPITSNTANLSTVTGEIRHAGGIFFLSRSKSLEIGAFDINLGAGKIFAKRVNYASASVPLLDVDLSHLTVSHEDGATILRHITLRLDPVAAGVLNSTFGISLPTDGSLVFGSASVKILD